MHMKLGPKLMLSFLLVVLMLAALGFYGISVSRTSLRDAVGKSSIFLAEEMLKRIERTLYIRIEELQRHAKHLAIPTALIASNREFEQLDSIEEYLRQRDRQWTSAPRDTLSPFMKALIGSDVSQMLQQEFIEFYENKYGYRIVAELFLTNRHGANVAQTGKTSDYTQDDEVWWQVAREQGMSLSAVEYDESAATYAIAVGIRIDDGEGDFLGVMKAVIAVKGIIREAEITLKKYETTRIKLLTQEGSLIYKTGTFRFFEDVSEMEFFRKIQGENGFFLSRTGARERLYSYARSKGYRDVQGLGWILVVEHDVKEVLQPALVLRNNMLAVSLLLMAVGILLAFLTSRSITTPIVRLYRGTEIIGRGNLDYTVGTRTHDELGELSRAFDRMTARLKTITVSRDALVQEIAERERAEEELRIKEDAIESSINAIGITDLDGKLLYVNDACVKLWGYQHKQEILGRYLPEFWHGEGLKTTLNDLKEKGVSRGEDTAKGKDGSIFPVQYSANIIKDRDGHPKYTFGSFVDITERKQAEQALQEYSEKLECMVAERTHELQTIQEQLVRHEKLAVLGQMAGSVGHELRTPLSTISNAVYYLKMVMSEPAESIAEYLDIIASEARNTEKIISDLLDFSRVKSLERQDIHVADVVTLVLEKHAPPDTIRVSVNIPDDLPAVFADPIHLEQVLSNLVLNAYQAMPDGGTLSVGSRQPAAGSPEHGVLITVNDTGCGIAPEHLEKLFEPLFTTKPKGIGLGLALSKTLIEANDGAIDVESEEGAGSVFSIRLPLAEQSK